MAEDAGSYRRFLNSFHFEGTEYELLLWGPDEKLVIMRLVDYGDVAMTQDITDDAEFERVVTHVKDSLAKSAREGKIPWWSLVASELFSGFGIQELPHYPLDRQRTAIMSAPGDLEEFTALRFTIDDRQNVVGFGLELDRSWLDGSALGMRQGGYLAKNVMESLAAVDPVLREVADQVSAAALIPLGTVLGFPHNLANPNYDPDIDSFVRTFRDPRADAATVTGSGTITATNVTRQGRSWLVIEWEAGLAG